MGAERDDETKQTVNLLLVLTKSLHVQACSRGPHGYPVGYAQQELMPVEHLHGEDHTGEE